MTEKKKILVLSDHPLSPSGVGTQTKYFIESLLKTNRYKFVCFFTVQLLAYYGLKCDAHCLISRTFLRSFCLQREGNPSDHDAALILWGKTKSEQIIRLSVE